MNWELILSYIGGIITVLLIQYFRCNKRKLLSVIAKTKVISTERDKIKQSVYKSRGNVITKIRLAEDGVSAENIITEIRTNYEQESKHWVSGCLSGSVYYNFDHDQSLSQLIGEVYRYSFMTNSMHVSNFPSVINQEVQVVRWVADMYHGDANVVGVMTMGGTDSVMEACLTYRKIAQKEYGIPDPVIIIPSSAHVSFLKAGEDHSIEIIVINVNPQLRTIDIKATEAAIRKYGNRVIALVGSAPSYADGVVDDIEALAKLATHYSSRFNTKIHVHVDCCLGSFIIPFTEERFDFIIPEVTSISVDTHKYGNCAKGSSVLLYRNMDIMRHQIRIFTQWEGGLYPCSTRLGSRPSGLVTCTYTVMKYFGLAQYRQFAEDILMVADKFRQYIKLSGILQLVGDSRLMVVAFKFKHDKYNIYQLAELLKTNHHIELNKLQNPNRIHICFTNVHTNSGFVNNLIRYVNTCAQLCIENPDQKTGEAAMYCTLQQIPKDIAEEAVLWYQEATVQPILQVTQ